MRYVYLITNLTNGKVYIGQTKNFANRKAGHLQVARRGNLRPLYCSIRKHGESNFKFEVIEECDDAVINEREQFWVAHYDSFNHEKGYNLTRGGSFIEGQHFSVDAIEARRKNGKIQMTKLNQKQWLNPERKNQVRLQNQRHYREGKIKAPSYVGRKHSQRSKDAIGRANSIAQQGEKNSMFGTIWVSNHDEKISKRILKIDLQIFLDKGWQLGRKMKWL